MLVHIKINSFQRDIRRSFLKVITVRFWISFLRGVWTCYKMDVWLLVTAEHTSFCHPENPLSFSVLHYKDVCTEKKETMCYRIWRKKIHLVLLDLYYWLIWVLGIVTPTVSSKFFVFSTIGQQAQSCHSVVSILFYQEHLGKKILEKKFLYMKNNNKQNSFSLVQILIFFFLEKNINAI